MTAIDIRAGRLSQEKISEKSGGSIKAFEILKEYEDEMKLMDDSDSPFDTKVANALANNERKK